MLQNIGVIVIGCSGQMGSLLCERIIDEPNLFLLAGVDILPSLCATHKSVNDIDLKTLIPDDAELQKHNLPKLNSLVVVDFSVKSNIGDTLEFCKNNNCSLIVARTDLCEGDFELLNEYAGKFKIFCSGNLSMGVFACLNAIKTLDKFLPDCKIEIIESHHKKKLDKPSKTAKMMAAAITHNTNCTDIHSIRAGNICGTHKIMFVCDNEIVSLEHTAQNRQSFIDGAIKAINALVALPQSAGMFDNDIVFADININNKNINTKNSTLNDKNIDCKNLNNSDKNA